MRNEERVGLFGLVRRFGVVGRLWLVVGGLGFVGAGEEHDEGEY